VSEPTLALLDPTSVPFWEAATRHELFLQRCEDCGHHQLYPRPHCLACFGPVEWVASTGRGEIHSFTVIRQNFVRPFRDELPYVVALVDLDEGARLMTNVVGSAPEDVTVGARVRVRWLPVSDEAALPQFELEPLP
jgi:uncharacterized OB-fold protein